MFKDKVNIIKDLLAEINKVESEYVKLLHISYSIYRAIITSCYTNVKNHSVDPSIISSISKHAYDIKHTLDKVNNKYSKVNETSSSETATLSSSSDEDLVLDISIKRLEVVLTHRRHVCREENIYLQSISE
jgi:hypothetical protein